MTLQTRMQAFEASRVALLAEMEAMEPEALLATPRAGKWSMLQIIEHLVVAERAVLNGLPDPSSLVEKKRRLKHRVRYHIVMFVLRSGIPVRVPSPAMIPRGVHSLVELRQLWDENQAWLRLCVDRLGPAGVRKALLRHPIAGPLSVENAVRMGQIHLNRHRRQILVLQRLLA